jgi:cell division protein FtsL
MMSRLAMLLLVCVVVSALYVVQEQYRWRLLNTEIDHAARDAQQLVVDHERLEVERRTAATSLRVEQIAHDKLAMRPITPAITDYVKLPKTNDGSAADASPARAASAAGGAS